MRDDDPGLPDSWALFTPDFDYAKEPYSVRAFDGAEEIVCYPNAGMLYAMDGSDRYFYACQCEVRFVGWERFHAEYVAPEPRKPTRIEVQAFFKRVRRDAKHQRRLRPGEWRMR
jgi:hypothetical protein